MTVIIYYIWKSRVEESLTYLIQTGWATFFLHFLYKTWPTVYMRNKGLAWLGGWPAMQPGHCPLWWQDRLLPGPTFLHIIASVAPPKATSWHGLRGQFFLSYKRSLDVDGRVTLFPGKTFLHWTMSIESIIKLFEINNMLILFRHISFESIWLLNQKLKSPACYSNTMRYMN